MWTSFPLRRLTPALVCAAILIARVTCPADEVDTMRQELPTREEIQQLPADGGDEFNRLIFQSSPYLLQHARNPVDWWPWCDEAFERAAELDCPVFLSVGYSTCHWCHVMERESFEDEQIAAILNEHYVPIKVDREERPDIDEIYMTATQLMTGRGGWPNSLWLTPDRRPWYAGTYFPPEGRQGMPGFGELLTQLAETWDEQREDVEAQANQVQDAIRNSVSLQDTTPVPLTRALLRGAVEAHSDRFDERYGGFGGGPEISPHTALRLLLYHHQTVGHERALEMATETLGAMARGGIHDHIGGGFHRYSTDEFWLVPHFEKMLYDNGQLAATYALAHEMTASREYEIAARGICEWVLREMTDEAGGFYSALDADSEGVEGKYYVWERDEVIELLGQETGALACDLLNIKPDGNFVEEATGQKSDTNIPHLSHGGIDSEELWPFLLDVKQQLRERRAARCRPHRDEKVLAAWNGLMISGLAICGRVFEEQRYLDAAAEAGQFVLDEMRVDGRLMRVWRDGAVSQPAYLDDYAFLAVGLLDLHEATDDDRWLSEAQNLVDETRRLFEDRRQGGLFFSAADSEELLARVKRPFDQTIPSGNAMAALAMIRLAKRTGEAHYAEAAERALTTFSAAMQNAPTSTETLLRAAGRYIDLQSAEQEQPTEDGDTEPDARTRRGPVTVEAWASRRAVEAGDEVRVALRVALEDGWHINAHTPLQDHLVPTEVEQVEIENYALMETVYPEPVQIEPGFSEEPMAVYEGEVWILARIKVVPDAEEGSAPLHMTVAAQACDDTSCARPERYTVELPLRVIEDAGGEARHEAIFRRFGD